MGRAKTRRLLYFLTRYLQPTTAGLLDARDFAVATAQTFVNEGKYGFSDEDICTVRQAYAAVELGIGDFDCDGTEDDEDDDDEDGVLDIQDNCLGVSNPSQTDADQDQIGDACDVDDDQDGIADSVDNCPGQITTALGNLDPDGDGLGNACDSDDDDDGIPDDGAPGDAPCASGQTMGCDDNCIEDPNPTQFDGNDDGFGDACDPDQDGDGFYVLEDNCTFVSNADQDDTDGDGIGDACDDCPDVADNANAYTTGIPELGIDPEPLQPDSDGDGVADACDPLAFDVAGLEHAGAFWNPTQQPQPDGTRAGMQVTGPPGAVVRIPIDVCDPEGYATGEYVELAFEGLLSEVQAAIVDDQGLEVARSRAMLDVPSGPDRGFRFKPRCDRDWFLQIELDAGFPGSDAFTLIPDVVPGGGGLDDPWSSIPDALEVAPPPRPVPEPGAGALGAAAMATLARLEGRRRRRIAR
jgi:hypothetical protein